MRGRRNKKTDPPRLLSWICDMGGNGCDDMTGAGAAEGGWVGGGGRRRGKGQRGPLTAAVAGHRRRRQAVTAVGGGRSVAANQMRGAGSVAAAVESWLGLIF